MSAEQRAAARHHANEIRFARAARKRQLKALPVAERKALVAAWIENPPPDLATAPIGDVLLWIFPRQQSGWHVLLLFRLNIGESRTLGERWTTGSRPLTAAQRAKLVAALRP